MRIEFTARNFDITPSIKSHVREKLKQSVSEQLDGAHVILTVEKHRHVAELVVRRRGVSLTGRSASSDMYRSIMSAIARIESQLRRDHDKAVTRKRRGSGAKASVVARAVERSRPADERRSRKSDSAPEPTVPRGPRVITEPLDRMKPMGVEEALLLLETAERPFVAFRHAASGQFAVLYQRPDGRFGLVAPDD